MLVEKIKLVVLENYDDEGNEWSLLATLAEYQDCDATNKIKQIQISDQKETKSFSLRPFGEKWSQCLRRTMSWNVEISQNQ